MASVAAFMCLNANTLGVVAICRFYLTSSAAFVPLEQEPRMDIKKPSPPLRTHVPEDIFYPFVTSAAERQGGAVRIPNICKVVVALFILQLVLCSL